MVAPALPYVLGVLGGILLARYVIKETVTYAGETVRVTLNRKIYRPRGSQQVSYEENGELVGAIYDDNYGNSYLDTEKGTYRWDPTEERFV